MKHMIKNLSAGEISTITRSPNSQEREAVIASNRGCVFVRVNDQGYIVEELFEIYFNNKPLNFVGFINFGKFFVTTRNSKQVMSFDRNQDDNKDFKIRELRYIEYTT